MPAQSQSPRNEGYRQTYVLCHMGVHPIGLQLHNCHTRHMSHKTDHLTVQYPEWEHVASITHTAVRANIELHILCPVLRCSKLVTIYLTPAHAQIRIDGDLPRCGSVGAVSEAGVLLMQLHA